MKYYLLFLISFLCLSSFSQTLPNDTAKTIVCDTVVVTVRYSTIVKHTYNDTIRNYKTYKTPLKTQPPNQLPTASIQAVPDITLPINSVNLTGTGTDNDGTIAAYLWTRISGPSGFLITSPTTPTTSVTNLVAGTYTFQLKVTDNDGGVGSATVTFNVLTPSATPGKYEGFGSQAIGGENSGVVKTVTSESDFFNNLSSNRVIKFGANITLKNPLYATNLSFVTIDGNGFDVTFDGINDDGISFEGANVHNIILTNIRVTNCTGDGINVVGGAHDIVIDHCSSYGNGDGNIDVAADNSGKTYNVTVQWCFIGDNKGSGKTLVTGQSVSLHHNLYGGKSSSGEGAERNPFIHSRYSQIGSPNCDFRNNIVYNWGRYGSGIGYNATANFINNYYATNKSGAIDLCADPASCSSNSTNVSGNVQSGGANINGGNNHAEWVIPQQYKVTITDAKTAAADVKAKVGTAVKNDYEKGIINSITIN